MPKKILVNIITHQRADIFSSWINILKYFQSQGSEIYLNLGLFAKKVDDFRDGSELFSEEEKKLISKDVVRTKTGFILFSLKRNFFVLKNSRKILAQSGADLIYTPSSVLDFVVYPFWLKLMGKKIKWATTLANIVPRKDEGSKSVRFLAWFFFHISLIMIKEADIIFASTQEVYNFLLSKKFAPEKVILTGFAIENEMIEEAKVDQKYHIDALFVGRINETKGIFDMLKILSLVTKKYPDFQLVFMGDGDKTTKNKFQCKIKEMGLENNVHFLGFRTGLKKYNIIKSAKSFWFLSVSPSESFGIALLEAVCSGIPAFAYDLPQFRWLYPDGEVSISPVGDYRSVAQKVIQLFDESNFRNVKGKKLLGKYSWEKIAEIEFEEIRKIIG
jgi:glycosyltransferase involved in cell wall biosynthesis